MATAVDSTANGYTFQWKIENVFHWWWMEEGDLIKSPVFTADALEKTKWGIYLEPMNREERENAVGLYLYRQKDCNGPNDFDVNFQFAFLGKDGSILTERILKNRKFSNDDDLRDQESVCCWGFPEFEKYERVFLTEREIFLPEDTLTIQCCVWITDQKPHNSNQLFATTVLKIKRRYFEWKIDELSRLDSYIENKFRDYFIDCDLVLLIKSGCLKIYLYRLNDSVKYISCNVSIIDSENEKKNGGIQKYTACDFGAIPLEIEFAISPQKFWENERRYFPNDSLTLDFEFVLLTDKSSECRKNFDMLGNKTIENEKSRNVASLADAISSLFNDATLSDMEIRAHKKTFQVHRNILSARSSVFLSMFSHDMKEKNCGYVEISDFDDDTIHDMLLYIYSDYLKDVQFEKALNLYEIADMYGILCLKSKCSSLLRDQLSLANACDCLVTADIHNDYDLKRSAEDYILRQRKIFFFTKEWECLMRNNLKSAACLMYKKLTKRDLHLP